MTEFAKYVCWSPAKVNETVVVDAVNSSRAVFLATHRPTQVLRRSFVGNDRATLVDEEKMLEEFLAEHSGLLFAPIVGESGTGKSHLVRWLHLRLPPSDSRRVVYIPKYGTNLRGVIGLILAGMSGTVVDDLRAELDKAVDSLDEAGAPSRLLNELAASIEDEARVPPTSSPAEDDEYRRYLLDQLPKLLLDNVFRSELLKPDGVVDRLVREALAGKQGKDKSEPFAFSTDDLPLSVAEAKKASYAVQELFKQLVGSDHLQRVAVELLNDHLGSAIRTLFGMGGSRLFDVMLSVRKQLLLDGAELVLLIEDFTILQGIQRELLDAITEAPVRDGERVLCSIRVAMAVTTGYFETLADTFSTRGEFSGSVYSLDLPMAPSGGGIAPEDVSDFVGGYLNASRLGQSRLEEALAGASEEQAAHRNWVPNACEECKYHDACHEAFGISRDGFGLYPFNDASLDRAVQAKSPTNFDPRRILGTVVRYALDQHGPDIERGHFPSPSLLQHFSEHLAPLSPEVAEDIQALDPIDADRRIALLTLWGGRPTSIVNLLPGIHQAFAIPELADTELLRPRGRNPEPGEVAPQISAEMLPTKIRQRLDAIDQWSSGGSALDQALARDLRGFLHDAVVSHIDWNSELLHPPERSTGQHGTLFRYSSFAIENSLGGGTLPSSAIRLDLPASPAWATLFKAIVMYQHHNHWRFDRGDERLRQLLGHLDVWAPLVVKAIQRGGAGESDWDLAANATELLAFTARVLDLAGSHSGLNTDLINALLTETPTRPAKRNSAWDKLVEVAASDNRRKVREALLARIAARQGPGRPQAIDQTRILPAVVGFKRSWSLTAPPDEAPVEFRKLHEEVTGRLGEAIESELERLRAWQERVVSKLDVDAVPAEVVDEFARASALLLEAGVFEPKRLRDPVAEASKAFRRTRYSEVRTVAELLATSSSSPHGRLLSELAVDRTRPMQEIDDFVQLATSVLEASNERATQEVATFAAGGSADRLSPLLESLADLAAAMDGAIDDH